MPVVYGLPLAVRDDLRQTPVVAGSKRLLCRPSSCFSCFRAVSGESHTTRPVSEFELGAGVMAERGSSGRVATGISPIRFLISGSGITTGFRCRHSGCNRP